MHHAAIDAIAHVLCEQRDEARIHFDRDDLPCALREHAGEMADPGADLQHHVISADLCRTRDGIHGVAFNEKILAETFLEANMVLRQQVAHIAHAVQPVGARRFEHGG